MRRSGPLPDVLPAGSGWKSTWPIPGPRPRFRGKCQKTGCRHKSPARGAAHHKPHPAAQGPPPNCQASARWREISARGPLRNPQMPPSGQPHIPRLPAYRNLQNARQPLQASNLTNCGFSRQWPECRPFQNRDAPYRCRT